MPLSLSELKDRAIRFAQEWQGATDERADAQAFWIDFFHVFDIKRRRVVLLKGLPVGSHPLPGRTT